MNSASLYVYYNMHNVFDINFPIIISSWKLVEKCKTDNPSYPLMMKFNGPNDSLEDFKTHLKWEFNNAIQDRYISGFEIGEEKI